MIDFEDKFSSEGNSRFTVIAPTICALQARCLNKLPSLLTRLEIFTDKKCTFFGSNLGLCWFHELATEILDSGICCSCPRGQTQCLRMPLFHNLPMVEGKLPGGKLEIVFEVF